MADDEAFIDSEYDSNSGDEVDYQNTTERKNYQDLILQVFKLKLIVRTLNLDI